MESRKPKINNKHRSKPACKRHSKHSQSAGVCSICLTEKLSQLNNIRASSRAKVANSPSSSSSYISSVSSSSNPSSISSPLNTEERKSMRVVKNNVGKEVLKKSRSMVLFFQRRKDENDDHNDKKIQIKQGFWSKLLPRRNKQLMHSRTTREMVITTIY